MHMPMLWRAEAAMDRSDIADNLGWPASAVNTAASQRASALIDT
jgi:hypothetical protein